MGVEKLKVSSVDPRYVSQEEKNPVYRVDFWDENTGCDEHRLENAQCVGDVLTWAAENKQGRDVVIWVEYLYEGGTGLSRLYGWEPTSQGSPSVTDPYFCS